MYAIYKQLAQALRPRRGVRAAGRGGAGGRPAGAHNVLY